tara:strand:+ start:110 stop:460 length:351 start_codon:yes stop_codon:yes gene_type:complete
MIQINQIKKGGKMNQLNKVKFENYGNYSSDNYGSHSLKFTDPTNRQFWFSYKTLIAFYAPDKSGLWSTYVIQNQWSTTTGKHLNWIDAGNKKERLTPEDFENKYLECFNQSLKEVA